jgi:hypothetical protein
MRPGRLPDLSRDGRVRDSAIRRQQQHLAGHDREQAIALERQEQIPRLGLSSRRDDAEMLVVRRHEDVPAAEVDFASAVLPAHDEEFVLERTLRRDFELRDEALQHLAPRLRRRREIAELLALPAMGRGIVAHACDADEQARVVHDFREDQRRHVREPQFGGITRE